MEKMKKDICKWIYLIEMGGNLTIQSCVQFLKSLQLKMLLHHIQLNKIQHLWIAAGFKEPELYLYLHSVRNFLQKVRICIFTFNFDLNL